MLRLLRQIAYIPRHKTIARINMAADFWNEAKQGPHKCRLACSVGTYDAEVISLFYLKVYVIKNRFAVVADYQVSACYLCHKITFRYFTMYFILQIYAIHLRAVIPLSF